LQERLLSIVMNPRPMVHIGKNYVPEPRGHLGQSDARHVDDHVDDHQADDCHAA